MLEVFPSRSGTPQEFPLSSLIALEVLVYLLRKGNKMYTYWEGRNRTVFVHRWYDHLCRKSKRIF